MDCIARVYGRCIPLLGVGVALASSGMTRVGTALSRAAGQPYPTQVKEGGDMYLL